MVIPAITPGFEVFDTIRFQQIKEINKSYGNEILSDSTRIYMDSIDGLFLYKETPVNSYFFYKKIFYKNKNIGSKGLGFNYGTFQKGIGYFLTSKVTLAKPLTTMLLLNLLSSKFLNFAKKKELFLKPDILNGMEKRNLRYEDITNPKKTNATGK